MGSFLIQVSGKPVREYADPAYVEGTEGWTFSDEPLKHGEYFNASPYWKEEGYGRRDAWLSVEPGDGALLYCTSSVEKYGPSLSHLLQIDAVSRDEEEGARLEFGQTKEIVPNIEYSEIMREVEAGRFSENMKYCGQEGFNITEIEDRDIERVREKSNLFDPR